MQDFLRYREIAGSFLRIRGLARLIYDQLQVGQCFQESFPAGGEALPVDAGSGMFFDEFEQQARRGEVAFGRAAEEGRCDFVAVVAKGPGAGFGEALNAVAARGFCGFTGRNNFGGHF